MPKPLPLHAQHRVMQDRVAFAEIGIERGEGGEFAPDGIVGEVMADQLIPPGDDMRAGDLAELLRLAQVRI